MNTAVYSLIGLMENLKTAYSVPVVYDPALSDVRLAYRLRDYVAGASPEAPQARTVIGIRREPVTYSEEYGLRGILGMIYETATNTYMNASLGQYTFEMTILCDSMETVEAFELDFQKRNGFQPLTYSVTLPFLSTPVSYSVYWERPDSFQIEQEDRALVGLSVSGRVVGIFFEIISAPAGIIEEIRLKTSLESRVFVITP